MENITIHPITYVYLGSFFAGIVFLITLIMEPKKSLSYAISSALGCGLIVAVVLHLLVRWFVL